MDHGINTRSQKKKKDWSVVVEYTQCVSSSFLFIHVLGLESVTTFTLAIGS